MARGGRASFKIDYSKFEQNLEVLLRRVERGTKKATIAAMEEIMEDSLRQVPRDTTALASSAFMEIIGKSKNFTANFGYGGKNDPVNPKTGRRVSEYMVVVHEDLTAKHPIGNAKFLERPVASYQLKFGAKIADILKNEVGW
ncbi:hypothetical protein D3C71_234940 [compost metagenome]